MNASYDRTTDSLYIQLCALPRRRTVEVEEDVMVDLADDGEPVGYDIQHASGKAALIIRLILEETSAAEE